MATIQVDIVSAEGEIHSGTASLVFAPAKMGEVGIVPRHAPMLTPLKPGEVRVQDAEGKEVSFYITGGMLEVQPRNLAAKKESPRALTWISSNCERAYEVLPEMPTRLFNPTATYTDGNERSRPAGTFVYE
jgi:hypothetical protein